MSHMDVALATASSRLQYTLSAAQSERRRRECDWRGRRRCSRYRGVYYCWGMGVASAVALLGHGRCKRRGPAGARVEATWRCGGVAPLEWGLRNTQSQLMSSCASIGMEAGPIAWPRRVDFVKKTWRGNVPSVWTAYPEMSWRREAPRAWAQKVGMLAMLEVA